jgi:hypothetical protein
MIAAHGLRRRRIALTATMPMVVLPPGCGGRFTSSGKPIGTLAPRGGTCRPISPFCSKGHAHKVDVPGITGEPNELTATIAPTAIPSSVTAEADPSPPL